MKDFTLAELKNIAREERLSGWSKFKKDALFDFLVANNVDIAKYKKPKKIYKKTKKSVVVATKWPPPKGVQALDETIVELVTKNLNVKTKNELCKNLDIPFCDECKCANDAAKNGHLRCLKYLHEKGCSWDAKTCKLAAAYGHIECLKYLHKNGCPWDEWACERAAAFGHLEILKYLHENKCPWYEDETCLTATESGSLDCLKYLHKNGCSLDKYILIVAVEKGHLDVLKYLHKNGCPWHEYSCRDAAKYGHLDVLKYLHKNGCPWDQWACADAAENGQLECLDYLHKNGCPCAHNRQKWRSMGLMDLC